MINNDKMTKEEALAIAKTWNFLKDKNKEALETLIPELQEESEDEKIRKALFDLVKSKESEGYMVFHNVYIGSMLDWLEKQNERKPVLIIPKFRIGDEIKTSNEKSLTITKIDEKGYWSEELFICDFDEECLWELVEQKPTDKVEQKFHEGDWIIYNRNDHSREILQIYDIRDNRYYFNDNIHFSWSIKECDEKSHLWTIEDAKDGDILSAYECIVVFKEIDGLNIKCHCTYHYMNNPSFHVDTLQNKTAFHPATKEQWDQLKKVITDAGYKWDAEKRELIKIKNSNPTNVVNEPKLTKEDIDNLNKISKVIYEAGQVQCWYRCERIISTEESDRLCDWLKSFYNKLSLL